MENVINFIKKNKLIEPGEIIGVACSGGRDSMSLLHYLNSIKSELDCEIIAINIDHSIREHSAADSQFVLDYCAENNIRAYKFKVEALKLAKENKMSVEQAAREARYKTFASLIQKGLIDKIATAHHLNDQAETILLNLLRGCGLSGAKGMEPIRDQIYIRPLIETDRADIMAYIDENGIPYVEDETNADSTYSRNYIRNEILPLIRKKFRTVDRNLVQFAKICSEDDEYINSQVEMGGVVKNGNIVNIPLSYFSFKPSIINRILMKALQNYSLQDIEKKHIAMIKSFAEESENGASIDLPFGIKVCKEYDYLSFVPKNEEKRVASYQFTKGKTYINGFGTIRVVSSKVFGEIKPHSHTVDANKIPFGAIWRYRKQGDMFTPFGDGGTKSLKEYLIDKKIPARLRDRIPVLALDDEIYIVADIEISQKLKVDENSTQLYKIHYEKDFI
ncbi:MAG: tRNA lysidine(34) synthetase TilS [Clostridia bacterium]|nr:tRNA lysidine(34) synthetase TilS [Clostridia bacterium]